MLACSQAFIKTLEFIIHAERISSFPFDTHHASIYKVYKLINVRTVCVYFYKYMYKLSFVCMPIYRQYDTDSNLIASGNFAGLDS